MSRISSVTPQNDYCLEVIFENGKSVLIDFKRKLHMIRFSILSDKEYFHTATTNGAFVRWSFGIEISAGEVLELAQKQQAGKDFQFEAVSHYGQAGLAGNSHI